MRVRALVDEYKHVPDAQLICWVSTPRVPAQDAVTSDQPRWVTKVVGCEDKRVAQQTLEVARYQWQSEEKATRLVLAGDAAIRQAAEWLTAPLQRRLQDALFVQHLAGFWQLELGPVRGADIIWAERLGPRPQIRQSSKHD